MTIRARTILQTPLASVNQDSVLDITPDATPQRYRLIHCDRFVEDQLLHIEEFTDFPSVQYAAISYVWKGNPLEPSKANSDKSFSVAGALDGDPISIHTLSQACLTAVKHGAHYIWLDRLCIMQTNSEDKHWQIRQMSEMYKRCDPCIILPGGVQKLVRVDEDTAWIHRGWTLQELLLPQRAFVLLAWKLGSGLVIAGDASGTVTEVTANESAVMSAPDILNACVAGCIQFTSSRSSSPLLIRSCVFGSASPNLFATSVAMSEELARDPDARNHAIWQSALMRTSSRPVDMVFSIMGLLGVLCTFPIFAETSVSGKALVRTKTGLQEVSERTMDDDGYFTFSSRAVCLAAVTSKLDHRPKDKTSDSGRRLITSMNGSVWEIVGDGHIRGPSTYGVILGWFQEFYPGATLAHNQHYIKGMIVEEHTPERFHIVSFFSLHLRDRAWVKSWQERQFSVGGPKPLAHKSQTTNEAFDENEVHSLQEVDEPSRKK
ncbi:uncharacterized protein EDB93DRAFT_1249064 [Suillus bovinus]|uniref:uncharacterized protein n=1 Tax=Suillus bovinus TaxID=48563 RepID=UPI001B86BF32|nr:uncharacterized protein EDB93DRAFT_1249064 [Suillus bovinus]KAG2152545.1 hypothetical protein EDB93DRAFT_1249064 [Suillus bovinus]